MDIIVRGKEDFQKFFGIPRDKERDIYAFSRFLLRQETKEGVLLCNTMTGELVLLSSEEMFALEAEPIIASSATNELIRRRFLVRQGTNEVESVGQLRNLMLKKTEAKRVINQYVILPTTFCNARCFYCYESRIRHVHMSKETANQLVDFIAAHHGDRAVYLSWFGGEPLIGRERIDQICHGLHSQSIPYTSMMTSNGYLFDADLVHHARETWHLKSIQITLDGTEEVYNRVKAYIAPTDNPYQRVLQNIGFLIEAGIHVKIRLNMDGYNALDLETLIQELSERFKDRSNLHVYVSGLNEDVGFEPIHRSMQDREKQNTLHIKLQNLLEAKGWPVFRANKLPNMQTYYCVADTPGALLCTPDGIFGKCMDHIYEDTVGSLTEGVTDLGKIEWWQQRTVLANCDLCPLYPSCNALLMHCPVFSGKCDADAKERRIADYKALMLRKYAEWKEK